MAESIYDIDTWGEQVRYKKNDIVQFPNDSCNYFYALADHTKEIADFTSSVVYNSTKWSNGKEDFNDQSVPNFFWEMSYGSRMIEQPNLVNIRFGEGVEHTSQDGINADLLMLNVIFANRTLKETTAILHFLHSREGSERFSFTAPKPYSKKALFICPEWAMKSKRRDSYDTSAFFEQVVPNPYQFVQEDLT
jgi:phage-related protein